MKFPVLFFLFKTALWLVLLTESGMLPAQGRQGGKAGQKQQLNELNKAVLADSGKQAELLQFYRESFAAAPPVDDSLAHYLARLDPLIDRQLQQHISFPVRLREDCRQLIRRDLRELTMNGVRAGYAFKQIKDINDQYLRDLYTEYRNNYRPGFYLNRVPEFGRADYLKAIRHIFTTIATLRVRSLLEDVHVVVYAMRDNRFVARSSGKTEFVAPLESGNYIVELSKPGFRKKLKKVVLGKYPKTIIIDEVLLMQ